MRLALKMKIDLNISQVIEKIKEKKANSVLIQLPDGLKPKAKEISDKIEAETGIRVYTYLGSCYGSCDVPTHIKVDLIVQWGHSTWVF